MRFTGRIYVDGEERVRTFFAWLPVSVYKYPTWEMRWLTSVTVRQRFCCFMHHGWWDNVAFEPTHWMPLAEKPLPSPPETRESLREARASLRGE
jgi:hypothetical protein